MSNLTELTNGIFSIMTTGDSSNTLNFTANITITTSIPPIYLNNATDTLTINGGGFTLSGGATRSAFLIERGVVAIDNLVFANMRALGGRGGTNAGAVAVAGGGGALGAGSAIFVGSQGNVTATNITFSGTFAATGGDGGAGVSSSVASGGAGGGGLLAVGGNVGLVTNLSGAGGGGGYGVNGGTPNRAGAGGGGMFGSGGGGNTTTVGGCGGGGVKAGSAGGAAGVNGGVGGFGSNGTTQAASVAPTVVGNNGASYPIGGGGSGGGGYDTNPGNSSGGNGGNGGFGGGGGGGGGITNAGTGTRGNGGNGGIFGGGGGAGGASTTGNQCIGGAGGAGGDYGGGGGSSYVSIAASGPVKAGGAGGFGGGGGAAGAAGGLYGGNGGAGGFGAGGGGGSTYMSSTGTQSGSGGSAGLGGGNGGSGGTINQAPSGGGGAALGGVIFVRSGGVLSIDASIPTATLTAGNAGSSGSGTAGQNGQAFGTSIFINGNTSLTFDISSGTKTVSGTIVDDQSLTQGSGTKGNGSIVKTGSGTLQLDGNNTYTGTTTISNGSLILTGNVSLLTGNTINNGQLVFNLSSENTFSSNISGGGSLTKLGSGTLTLTGTNSYSNGTTISAGTLKGNSSSITGDVAIGSNALVFEQTTDGTYSGNLTGTGMFTKAGAGTLTFSGDGSNFTGQTELLAGSLTGTGGGSALSGTVTIAPAARLDAFGQLDTVINNGTLGPQSNLSLTSYSFSNPADKLELVLTSSIGSLTIEGDYTQGASGLLEIEITNAGAVDFVNVLGSASLGGNVHAILEDGIYIEGTPYLFLSANGGYGSTRFAGIIEESPQEFNLVYIGNKVYIVVNQNFIISTWAPYLTGNAKKTYDYLTYDPGDIVDPNLIDLLNTLFSLPSLPAFTNALEQLCPALYSALPLVSFQNNLAIAKTVQQQVKATLDNCYCNSQVNYWIEPIAFYYNQKAVQEQFGFNNYSVGLASGFLVPISNSFFINPSIGYTHSITKWNNNYGKAKSSTVYFAPSFGYSNGESFASIIVQGDIDFYRTSRYVSFTGFSVNPETHFRSYNMLYGLETGTRYKMSGFNADETHYDHDNIPINYHQDEGVNFYLQPEFNLYFLKLYQVSFTEGSNSYINLEVRHKCTTFIQPSIGIKFIPEIVTKNYYISPTLYLGYLSNIPLGPTGIVSKFYQMDIPLPHFSVEGYNRVVNQLSAGFELVIVNCKDFQFSVGYNLDVLSHMNIQLVKLNLNWSF